MFTLQIISPSWWNWKWPLQCLLLPMDWFHEGSSRQECSKEALETGNMLATPETELSSVSTNNAHWGSFNFINQPLMGCIQKTSVFDMDSFSFMDLNLYKVGDCYIPVSQHVVVFCFAPYSPQQLDCVR